jgi:hypothetical protein
MAVTGAYLQANSQVVAVSGNTITLSAPVALEQVYPSQWSATGTIVQYQDRNKVYFSNLSTPMVVGQYLVSSLLPLARRAVITRILNQRIVLGKTVTRSKIAVLSQSVFTNAKDVSVTWTAYIAGSFPSTTYSFTATNRNYTFRGNFNVPFGSFPGIGTFAA